MFGRKPRKKRKDAGVRRSTDSPQDTVISFRLHPEKDAAAYTIYEQYKQRDPNMTNKDIFLWALLNSAGVPTRAESGAHISREDLEWLREELVNALVTEMEQRGVGASSVSPEGAERPRGRMNKEHRAFLKNLLGGFNDPDDFDSD